MSGAGEDIPEGAEDEIEPESVAPGFNKELRRLLFLLVAAAAAFVLLYFTPVGGIVRDIHQLRAFLAGDDLWAEIVYVLLVVGLVAVGTPRLVFYVLGGLAFGFWQGLALAQVGAVIGSWITFWAVRHGGRAWFERHLCRHRRVGRAFRVRSSVNAGLRTRTLPLTTITAWQGIFHRMDISRS